MSRGFVYLLQAVGTSYYKIGRTENIPNRIRELSGQQSPFELKLIDYFFSNQASKDERLLQSQLANYRVKGEWFNLPELIASDRLWFKPLEWLEMEQSIKPEFDPDDTWMFVYGAGGLYGTLDRCITEAFERAIATSSLKLQLSARDALNTATSRVTECRLNWKGCGTSDIATESKS